MAGGQLLYLVYVVVVYVIFCIVVCFVYVCVSLELFWINCWRSLRAVVR